MNLGENEQSRHYAACPIVAEVWRGGICECVHHGAWVEADANGDVLHAAGDPALVTTLRSSGKPLQAIPITTLRAASDIELSDEELAIICASHPGTPRHAALAASVLALSGYLPDELLCGAPAGIASPLCHGCSGNHAGILLTAHLLEVSLADYGQPAHPAQRLIAETIADLAGAPDSLVAPDGCGVPTFGLSMRQMARCFARLVRPGAPWERLPRAMALHPELVGAEDWIDVRLMQATRGRIIAKTGAEGLLCLALPERQLGMAVKILDGSTRALGAATIAALLRTGWLSEAEAAHPLLALHRRPVITNSLGEPAAEIRALD